MLFSATQTRKIEDLARISLKKEPLYVGVDDQKDKATVEGLEQVCITLWIVLLNEQFYLILKVILRITIMIKKVRSMFIDILLTAVF